MFEIYDQIDYLEHDMVDFTDELLVEIGRFCEVSWPGVCKTREQVEGAISGFESDELDGIIVVLLTYAPSYIAAKPLLDTRLPLMIFNTQRLEEVADDMDPKDLIRNHGVHGVQDLANVLGRAGGKFSVVTGHYRDQEALGALRDWCLAASMVSYLSSQKVGVLGNVLRGMGDFSLDETQLLCTTGVEVVHLAQREVARLAGDAPEEEIRAQMEENRKRFQVSDDVTPEEHEESSRLEWAIRQVLVRGGMDSLAANFMSIDEEMQLSTLPFLASSKLLSEGFGYAAEGDVLTAITVGIMQRLAGAANFTEMFTMDPKGNALLMSHMGESNPSMAREDRPIELIGADFELASTAYRPLLLRFALAPGKVTLVNLTVTKGGRFKIISTRGSVLDFPPIQGINTPHFKFKPELPLADFLTKMCTEGSSHHFALAYGNWTGVVSKIADILGIEFSSV
jgi:L-arabinose isomerase